MFGEKLPPRELNAIVNSTRLSGKMKRKEIRPDEFL
jgi:hypothetical protein